MIFFKSRRVEGKKRKEIRAWKDGELIEINISFPSVEKKEKRGNRRGSSRGPRIEIHARLIPAYFGLSQSFLPRSPLLPGANYVKSTSRDNAYARRVHVAGTEISKVSGQCRSIDKTGGGGPFLFIPFFFLYFFFSFLISLLGIRLEILKVVDENFSFESFLFIFY